MCRSWWYVFLLSTFSDLIFRGIYIQRHKKSGYCTHSGYFNGWSCMGIFLFWFFSNVLVSRSGIQCFWISHRRCYKTYSTHVRAIPRILLVSEDWYILLVSIADGDEIVTETVFDVFLDAYIHALHNMEILLRNKDESYDEERMRYQKARELASTAQRNLRLANIHRDQSELKKETLAMDALNTLSKRYDIFSPLYSLKMLILVWTCFQTPMKDIWCGTNTLRNGSIWCQFSWMSTKVT